LRKVEAPSPQSSPTKGEERKEKKSLPRRTREKGEWEKVKMRVKTMIRHAMACRYIKRRNKCRGRE